MKMDLSVHKVKLESSPGFWQYFSLHNNPDDFGVQGCLSQILIIKLDVC